MFLSNNVTWGNNERGIVGFVLSLTNQTSERSIGPTCTHVANMFLRYFHFDAKN